MTEKNVLTEQFHLARGHLRAVAFRMLGSVDEADDALQEAWLRASTADVAGVGNVTGWLTTILSRVCLDMLRARARRGREGRALAELEAGAVTSPSPEDEQLLCESAGLAMLVVLERLSALERVAFVLHDVLSVPFEEIAGIIERSPSASKKLASRARHRVRGAGRASEAVRRHREVVEAYLAAARAGDVERIVTVLAPDVVRRVDRAAQEGTAPLELRGARAVAKETAGNAARATSARPILVDGAVGALVAPRGRLRFILEMEVDDGRIVAIDVIGERATLRGLELTLLEDAPRSA